MLYIQLRLVFILTEYQEGTVTIVHAKRVLFLERVTHKNSVTCLSLWSENKCGGTIGNF